MTDLLRQGRLTRREFIQRAMVLGMSFGAATVAAQFQTPFAPRPAAAAPVRAATGGGQVIVGTTQELVNFNPLLFVNVGPEAFVVMSVFDTLWKLNDKGEFVPDLAAEIPTVENGGISSDGLEFTVHLRNDVYWHDGEKFTARDVQYTWEIRGDRSIPVNNTLGLEQTEYLKAVDDTTLKIKLKGPFAPFMTLWAGPLFSPIPEHILSKEKDFVKAPFNSVKPIGTGPFVFAEQVSGDHITLEKNSKYHGKQASLDRLISKYIPDTTSLLTQLKTGEIDITDFWGIDPANVEEARQLANVDVKLWPTTEVQHVFFNIDKPMFSDPMVRKALYMALDVDTLNKMVFFGVNPRTVSYLPPSHWAYNTNLKPHAYDPEQAKALLEQAGWKVGADGIREKDGLKLKFTCSTTAGNKTREQSQALFQQWWKDIGAAMEINNMPASVVWGDYTYGGKFDTVMAFWGNPTMPDPDCFNTMHSRSIPQHGGNGNNVAAYSNPEVDKLIEQGETTIDREKRKEIYWKIQEIAYQETASAPLHNGTMIVGVNKRVKNYLPNPYAFNNVWNVADWEVSG
jgi:peptide/nickel transport system substrate-binding protein